MVGRLLIAAAASALVAATPAEAHPPRHRARVWYVRATAKPGGDGTHRDPFDTLTAVQRASRAGDRIVVLPSPAPLAGGIALKPRQNLIGAGPSVLSPRIGAALPRIVNPSSARLSGDAVRLATGDTVRNMVIGGAFRGGIYGSGVTAVTIAGNDVSATNSSCSTGFVVQPFKLPTLAPGVAVPFSAGLPNGWAAIMLDEPDGAARLRIRGNYVHDASCADGIDVRASGSARVSALVTGNRLTRLREGATQQSVLAIGLQTRDTARLDAHLDRNAEAFIGSASLGDEGVADSEGLFANSSGHSRPTERVTSNTFAHGLGHLSANCFEVVSSSGGPAMDVALSNSTCDWVVGDILEAANLSAGGTMRFAIDHVRAAHSEFLAGPAFHQLEPGDDGVCLFELGAGAGSSTSVQVTDSLLTGCVTDGLEAAASVADGSGPVRRLSFDVRDSRIVANTLSNLRVANSSPVLQLDGRVERSDLAGTPGTPIILENLTTAGGTRARLDFGGGSLASPGGNCISGGWLADIEAVRASASARGDLWGSSLGPAPGRVIAAGGSVDTGRPLARAPAGC